MWELVNKSKAADGHDTHTERFKVYGGWIVRTFHTYTLTLHSHGGSCAMVFVPDRDHFWRLEKDK